MYSLLTFNNQIATVLSTNSFGPNTESRIYFVMSDALGVSGCNEFTPLTTDSVIQIIDSNVTINYLPFNINAVVVTMTATNGVNSMNSLCSHDYINELKKKCIVTVFPNPTNDLITIENSIENLSQIKIFNQLGDCIYTSGSLHDKRQTINCEKFSSGIYFVQLQTDSGQQSIKFIKE